MKKIFLLIAIAACTQLHAQLKEGTVKYNLSISGPAGETANPMLGTTECIVYFKPGKSLAVNKNNLYKTTVLSDEKGTLTLMDMSAMDQKWFIRKTLAEMEAAKKKNPAAAAKVTETKEKKMIMGYECTKALLSFGTPGKMNSMTVWYTEKIQNIPAAGAMVNPEMFEKLKGMPLEIDMNQSPVAATMTVTSISPKPIPDAVFNVSTAGYTEKKTPAPAVKK